MSFICRNCGIITDDYIYNGNYYSCCPEREPVKDDSKEFDDIKWGWKLQRANRNLQSALTKVTAERDIAVKLLEEIKEYLNHKHKGQVNAIHTGSIFHKEITEALQKIGE